MATAGPEFQRLLAGLATRLSSDIVKLTSRMDRLDRGEAMRFVTDAYPEIVTPYAAASAELSAQWYDELPGGTRGFLARPAELAPTEQLGANARWALTQRRPAVALRGSGTRTVFDSSRRTVRDNAERENVRWTRYASANACGFCRMLTTRVLTLDNPGAPGLYRSESTASRSPHSVMRGHDHCVPAGTVVSGPATAGAYRRFYEGEVIVIDTAAGEQLTITANHPVLTDKGWVPADFVKRGDNVIRSASGQARPVTVPDEHQQPTLIENVWGSLAVNGLVSVPGAAEQFHGDGRKGEVEIVGAYGFLHDRVNAALAQPPLELVLAGAGGAGVTARFPRGGDLASLLPGASSAPYGRMGGSSDALALLGAHVTGSLVSGLGPVAGNDAQFGQAAAYHDSRHAETCGHVQLGQSLVDVHTPNFTVIKSDSSARRFDPAGSQFSIENGSAYSELGLNLLRGLGAQVELDRVVEARRVGFSGHVYNLETSEGWYLASSLIVSNCKCLAVPVRNGNYQAPGYVHDWLEDYQKVSRNDNGVLLPEWKIADLMEKAADERHGRVKGGRKAAREADPVKTAGPAKAEVPSADARRDAGGRFAGTKHLIDRNNERAREFAAAARGHVQTVVHAVDRADEVLTTTAQITGTVKRATDLANAATGGAVPIIRNIKAVVDATDTAVGNAARVTGGVRQATQAAQQAVNNTARIAHGAQQIADEARGVADDVTAVALGIRELFGNAGTALRDTAKGTAGARSLADLSDTITAATETARRIQSESAALAERARAAGTGAQGLAKGIGEIPERLRAPLEDAQRLARGLTQAVDAASQSADDVAQIAHAVKGLVDALSGKPVDDAVAATFVYSERVNVELARRLGGTPELPELTSPAGLRAIEAAPRAAEVVDLDAPRALPAAPTRKALEAAPAKPAAPAAVEEVATAAAEEVDELERILGDANAAMEAGDFDKADELFAQAEKVEAQREAKAARTAKAAAKREAEDRDKQDRVLALIEEGVDPAEAESEVYGIAVETIRRRDFIAQARAEGHVGKGFDELLTSRYSEMATEQYWAAEQATNGYMIKRQYADTFDAMRLWQVNDATARKYMSDEMAAWFDEHGKITKDGLREAILEGRGAWRNARTSDYLQ